MVWSGSKKICFTIGMLCLFLSVVIVPVGAVDQNKPDPVYTLTQWQGTEVIDGEILVRFNSEASQAARDGLVSSLGAVQVEPVTEDLQRVRWTDPQRTIDEAMAYFQADPQVLYAEPNRVYRLFGKPNDTRFEEMWGMKKIRCPEAWNFWTGDASVVVAVIDTGVDIDHPDLADHYAYGYDFYSGDPDPNDHAGHGSHTCGTVAALTDNNLGVAGVAANCLFAAYRTGDYWLPDSAIVSSIYDAIDKGAQVISMSFGSGSPGASIETALTDAYEAGIVCVASAGNDGDTAFNYPAAYDMVISVAASTKEDNRASFSTYGSWVDVAAPGKGVLSSFLNGGYHYYNGTSMACPHVSGLAGLLYSFLGGTRTKANADIVRQQIEDTAVNVGSWVIHGRIDAYAAILPWITIEPPVITDVSPNEVPAFECGTVTLTGSNLGSVTELNLGNQLLFAGTDFEIFSNEMIKFTPPVPTELGVMELTVTNPEGTSDPSSFTYVETSPVKLKVPLGVYGGGVCRWDFAGGVGRNFLLLLSDSTSTFNYQGYNILSEYHAIGAGVLTGVGIGSMEETVPQGLQGMFFYSQFVTFGPGFLDVSGISFSLVMF